MEPPAGSAPRDVCPAATIISIGTKSLTKGDATTRSSQLQRKPALLTCCCAAPVDVKGES